MMADLEKHGTKETKQKTLSQINQKNNNNAQSITKITNKHKNMNADSANTQLPAH